MNRNVERAAGGFVVRQRGGVREVLMIDDAYGHVAFPKGHVEPGESWEQAAVREVAEETGIEARILQPLSRVEYEITRAGQPVRKQVRLFLMEAVDAAVDPVPQEVELRSAYFLPWDEAAKRHAASGYANWGFAFAKADVLWRLHEGGLEGRLRAVAADDDPAAWDDLWQEAAPVIRQLASAVRDEVRTVAPAWPLADVEVHPEQWPRPLSDPRAQICAAVEHTLLKPEASALAVEAVAHEALAHRFRAVCVNPQHIGRVADILAGSDVIPCVVVGFPLGATDTAALAAETEAVVRAGAREVDMVIPVGSMMEDDIWSVYERVAAVCASAHRTSGVQVKVILETHFLTYAQVAVASVVALSAGADFVKTSTGFAPSGAKLADVALMASLAGGRGVKAAGGVRTRRAAEQFLRYGATRLGTSSGPALIR
ncbi:MAG: deoxyribose-phosphate aldolase [Alicyclobacillus sp.]|nr:deoxyribose-phosphate aldolase [Alicyclobacillus sp.]